MVPLGQDATTKTDPEETTVGKAADPVSHCLH